MAENDENEEVVEEATPEATPSETTDKPKASREIRADVADRLKSVGEPVRAAVTDILYGREEERRVDAVVKVIDEIETKERDLKKIDRGDIEHRDEEGRVVNSYYSKQRIEERKKLREEIGKLNGKLELALVKGDWSKLLGG